MEDKETPTVTIVLLGDPGCGKTTFLSYLVSLSSPCPCRKIPLTHNNCNRRLSGGLPSGQKALPEDIRLLRDLDQPFAFDIRMYSRPYRFEFYDTASPENYTLLSPDFVILCYDISDRASLMNAQEVWRKVATRCYRRQDDDIPVMLLGLKRDLRVEGPELIDPLEVSESYGDENLI